MRWMTTAMMLLAMLCFSAGTVLACPECEGGACEGCDKDKKETTEKTEAPAGNVFEISIEGMCCANCVKAIEKRLSKLENVESVKVDLKEGKAWVTMKEGKTLEKATVEKSFEDTEFKATAVVKFEPKKEEKKEDKKEG